MSKAPTPFSMLILQLVRIAEPEQHRGPGRINPRPPGQIIPGSVTDRILRLLQAHPARWYEHYELCAFTGGRRGGVSRAVAYLGEQGLVKSGPSLRNPTYRKYRLESKGV